MKTWMNEHRLPNLQEQMIYRRKDVPWRIKIGNAGWTKSTAYSRLGAEAGRGVRKPSTESMVGNQYNENIISFQKKG